MLIQRYSIRVILFYIYVEKAFHRIHLKEVLDFFTLCDKRLSYTTTCIRYAAVTEKTGKHIECVTLEGVGHMGMMEAPEKLAAAIRSFVDNVYA